eukprot:CAMPEP_0184512390 /NCGR_PEP_ID=MMETSP0198_2-20121128/2851_1 /TAXON_ID=1112570 /ORGANISM="Thraustochytrium sp., Strain LLF1b" /LENGTH=94 /DNA_ID=CAMNT_0026902403 /DNA_START=227 /DNA_END=511 /DNA_ORIENTATION=-
MYPALAWNRDSGGTSLHAGHTPRHKYLTWTTNVNVMTNQAPPTFTRNPALTKLAHVNGPCCTYTASKPSSKTHFGLDGKAILTRVNLAMPRCGN